MSRIAAKSGEYRLKQSVSEGCSATSKTAAEGAKRPTTERYKLRISYGFTPRRETVTGRLIRESGERQAAKQMLYSDDSPGDERVYFMQRADGLIKIGYSRSPKARMAGVALEIFRATGVRMPVAVLAAVPGDRNDEAQFHLRFLEHRLSGEWFSPSPELLSLIAEIQAQGGAR